MTAFANLPDALAALRTWLETLQGFPGWNEPRIVEVGRGTRYVRSVAGPWQWRIARSALRSPAEYAPRFDELLGAGYSWINLCCYGTVSGLTLFAVELPRAAVGAPRGRTSVNFSGPNTDLVRWNAEPWVVLEDD